MTDTPLFQQFAQKYKSTLQAQPEWVRNLHTAPSNFVADIVGLPALPSDLAAIVGMLSGSETAAHLSETLAPGFVQSARNLSQDIRDRATELAGVDPAIQLADDGTLDIDPVRLLLQEGPGALVPLGTPAKMTQATTRTGKLANIAKKTGNVVKEVALPGVQGKYAIGAPIQLAVTAGGPYAVDAGLELVKNDGNEPLQEPELFFPNAPEPFFPQDTISEPELFFAEDQIKDSEDSGIMKKLLWGGLATLTGVAGVSVSTSARNAARKVRRDASSILTGTAEKLEDVPGSRVTTDIKTLQGPITDKKTVGAIQTVNRYAALENAVNKSETPDADLFTAKLRTTGSSDSLGSRTKDALLTGRLPNSKVRTTPLTNHYAQLAKLTPDQQALYDDALVAGTKIDQMLREQNNVWGNQTYQSLDAIRQRAFADPKVKPLIEEARQLYGDALKYAVDRGTMTQEAATQMRINNPNFVPTRLGKEAIEDSILDIFKNTEPEMKVSNNLFEKRNALDEGIMPGEVVPPSRMHSSYLTRLIRYTEQNGLRRDFIDQMLAPGSKKFVNAGGKQVFEKVAKPLEGRTVTILRGGKQEHYVVRDNAIWSALQFTPNKAVDTIALIDNIRYGVTRLRIEGTTGVANPFFAPVSSFYDAFSSLATVPKGRGLGALDEVLMRLSDGRFKLGSLDLTALASPVTGTAKVANAKIRLAISQSLDASLRNDGFISKTLGPAETQRLRDVMLRAYENSSFAVHQHYGGGSFGALDAIHDTSADDILRAISPQFVQETDTGIRALIETNGISRTYVNALHTIKASNRVQFTGTNIKRDISGTINMSNDELTKLVAQSRGIGGGDLGVRGGDPNTALGRVVQDYTRTKAYHNAMVQEFRTLYNAIKDDPAKVAGVMIVTNGAMLAAVAENMKDERWRDWFVNRLTPAQRGRTLYSKLIPDTYQPVAAAQITPMQRPAWSMTLEAYLALAGYKSIPDGDARDVQDVLNNVLINGWGISESDVLMTPIPDYVQPALSAYSAATSIGDPDQETFAINELGGQRFAQTNVFDENDPAVYRNLEKMMMEIFGAAGQVGTQMTYAALLSLNNNSDFMKTADNVAEAATDRFRQPTVSGYGSSLWGTDVRLSHTGEVTSAYFNKMENVQQVIEEYNRGVRGGGQLNNITQGVPLTQPGDSLIGTQVEKYGPIAQNLMKELQPLREEYSIVQKEIDGMNKRPGYIKPDAKHPTRNEYIATIKELETQMLEIINRYEEEFGVDFSRDINDLSSSPLSAR